MSEPPPGSDTRRMGEDWFPSTHWSCVLAAGESTSPKFLAARDEVCRAYWRPLYFYIRRLSHSPEDAVDLTQGFFAHLLERNPFTELDRSHGKFRAFLLACLRHYLSDERDRANAAKRGAGKAPIPLEELRDQGCLVEADASLPPDQVFDRHWALVVLDQAFARLRTEFVDVGKTEQFDLLKEFLSREADTGDYARLAGHLRMLPVAVRVAVHRLRLRYRERVREIVAQTVPNPADVDDELRYLLRLAHM